MVAPRKPGADWNRIRRRYDSEVKTGKLSLRQLAHEEGLKAHQSIMERRDKEGWDGPELVGDQAPTKLPTAYQTFYRPANDLPEDTRGKKTPARVEAICQEIAAGASEATASVLNDITPATLRNWKAEDPEVTSAVLRAFASQGRKDETAVNDDIERGNANTALKRLSKNPLAKEHWADDRNGGAGIHITLNIPLPGSMPDPLTIEHESEAA